ncbi:MAG: M20/M25/M40 family metallo-hydrolase [Chloroflexi bacterium]|nr:M20/M25/M40 family metallo-hydrolase [Chloroflexota bacterium]
MIQPQRLLDTFLDLLQIPSPSGHEARVAEHLTQRLRALGLEAGLDAAGNVVAHTAQRKGALLLGAHMDTVGQVPEVHPIVEGDLIRSDGSNILGGDDKSGIAVILELLTSLLEDEHALPPLEVVFTVAEETGLVGAKALDTATLHAKVGVELDSGGPQGAIIVQAPAQDSLHVVIHGKKAHAGAEPEKGINAIRVAAEAIAAMPLGRINPETTANIGVIHGGEATNIVPDRVEMRGEARSRNPEDLARQVQAMAESFQAACNRHCAGLDLQITRAYEAYQLTAETPIVQELMAAVRELGLEPTLLPSGGGSDANILNARGITTVNLSTGMEGVHTTQEQVRLSDMVACARILENLLRARLRRA